MELKKLYRDTVVLCKKEIPLPDFLLWCDVGARAFLSRYPKRFLLPKGEYVTPVSLSDPLMISSEFYTAIIYFISGNYLANEGYIKNSENAASQAYLKLWREAARGKRMKGDKW